MSEKVTLDVRQQFQILGSLMINIKAQQDMILNKMLAEMYEPDNPEKFVDDLRNMRILIKDAERKIGEDLFAEYGFIPADFFNLGK